MVRSVLPGYGSRYVRLIPRLELLHRDLSRRKEEEQWDTRRMRTSTTGFCTSAAQVLGKALGGPWALGTLLAVATLHGSDAVASVVIAGIANLIAALCYLELDTKSASPAPWTYSALFVRCGEFPAFVWAWAWILGHLSALAATSRGLSAMVDASTGGRIRGAAISVFGLESPLGFFMDFPALGVCALPTALCACGLEEVPLLRSALNLLTLASTVLLALTHAIEPHPVLLHNTSVTTNVEKILTGAAFCCVSYLGVTKVGGEARKFGARPQRLLAVALTASLLVIFTCNLSIGATIAVGGKKGPSVSQSPASSAKELPLAALTGMGLHEWLPLCLCIGAVTCLGLALLEFSHPLHAAIQALASDGLLHRCLNHENSRTGTPLGAILGMGLLSGIMALLLDVPTLLGLVASAQVVGNALICTVVMHQRYQVPPSPRQVSSVPPLSPTKAEERKQKLMVCYLKDTFSSLKIPVDAEIEEGSEKRKASTVSGSSSSTWPCTARLGGTISESDSNKSYFGKDGQRPILLAESPTASDGGLPCSDTDDEEEGSQQALVDDSSEGETDIDAVVAEYREKVRVATLGAFPSATPTPATARRVSMAVAGLLLCCSTLALAFHHTKSSASLMALIGAVGLVMFLLLVVVMRQPQSRAPNAPFLLPMVPWLPAMALLLHACLLLQGLAHASLYAAAWWGIGLLIYFSYSVHHSIIAETQKSHKHKLVTSPGVSVVSALAQRLQPRGEDEERQHLTRVDTILIAR